MSPQTLLLFLVVTSESEKRAYLNETGGAIVTAAVGSTCAGRRPDGADCVDLVAVPRLGLDAVLVGALVLVPVTVPEGTTPPEFWR